MPNEKSRNRRVRGGVSARSWINRRRGQSLVEVALLFPILLILLSGVVEFGFAMNYYLNFLDGAREAARFASDGDPFQRDVNTNCSASLGPVTEDFYHQAACLTMQVARPLVLNPVSDDVVISAFGVVEGEVTNRLPTNPQDPPTGTETPGEWHLYGYGGACASQDLNCNPSRISATDIESRLSDTAPNTGIILVEVFFDYEQTLKLPWLTVFVPDPLHMHTYAIMPLVAAEPDL
jgi:hypothetical protein